MSLDTQLIAMAEAFGADIKAAALARGDLTALSTTAKASLVAAINELYTLLGSSGAVIDDNGTGTGVAWSASKILAMLDAAKAEVQSSILGGASAAYDTLLEIENLVSSNTSTGAALADAVAKRVRFDAPQTLTVAEKLQACQNIGVGDPATDFVAAYNAAKV